MSRSGRNPRTGRKILLDMDENGRFIFSVDPPGPPKCGKCNDTGYEY